MRLFTNEVKSIDELEKVLNSRNDVPKPYSVAVEALIFDKSGKWILMERGPGCRDEIGKFEGIGGRFENDKDFHSALRREIIEEIGESAEIEIAKFFEVRKDTVEMTTLSKIEKRHWIIVSFICLLKSGELKICEPQKNSGFVHWNIQEIEPAKLSSSAASALLSLKAHWPEIITLIK